MTDSIETLLRASTLTYGHIQLFRNAEGWQSSVYHYGPKSLVDSPIMDDPVDALRIALIEDERRGRDVGRRYDAAVKLGDPVQVQNGAVVGTLQETAPVRDDFEELFG